MRLDPQLEALGAASVAFHIHNHRWLDQNHAGNSYFQRRARSEALLMMQIGRRKQSGQIRFSARKASVHCLAKE
jgi:hypothetical protein